MRIPSLDGWRALAISIVVLGHFPYSRGFPLSPSTWEYVVQSELGVRIFFVISGFLITHLLLQEADRDDDVSLRAFYVRRTLRIFPVYFAYLGVVALLAIPGLYRDANSSWIGSLTFTRDLVGRGKSVTVHYWSLAVEEQFYVLWPVTLVTLRLWKRPAVAGALLAMPIILCPLFRSGAIQALWPHPVVLRALNYFSIARHADSLAVGCATAFLYRSPAAHREYSAWWLAASVLVFGTAAAMDDGRFGPAGIALLPAIEAVAAMAAIWITVQRRKGLIYRLLNSRAFVWLGTLSYSIYVWQQLFLASFAGPELARLLIYDWRLWWMTALACACASYYLLERPILRIRDRYRRVITAAPAIS